jgi:hypothetical protein
MRVGPLLALLADVKLPMSQPTVSLLAAAADGAGPLKDETSADPFLPAWRELLGDELAASEGKTTWNKMSYVLDLTAEAFALLAPHQKDAVHAKLVAVSRQSIPPTPRLAGMALQDRNRAKAKLEALGLAVDAPADKAHVGGHAVVDGKKYVIEPKEEM